MSVTKFCLLALLVTVTTVSSLEKKMVLPAKVISLHEQCTAKPGYIGECWRNNRVENKPHCGSVACASSVLHGQKHRAHFIENAPDGLKCGRRKVCYDGQCKKLDRGVPMPEQTATSFNELYDCYVVGGANTRRT